MARLTVVRVSMLAGMRVTAHNQHKRGCNCSRASWTR